MKIESGNVGTGISGGSQSYLAPLRRLFRTVHGNWCWRCCCSWSCSWRRCWCWCWRRRGRRRWCRCWRWRWRWPRRWWGGYTSQVYGPPCCGLTLEKGPQRAIARSSDFRYRPRNTTLAGPFLFDRVPLAKPLALAVSETVKTAILANSTSTTKIVLRKLTPTTFRPLSSNLLFFSEGHLDSLRSTVCSLQQQPQQPALPVVCSLFSSAAAQRSRWAVGSSCPENWFSFWFCDDSRSVVGFLLLIHVDYRL